MDEENREEYFRTLITQPHNHSSYNEYDGWLTANYILLCIDNEYLTKIRIKNSESKPGRIFIGLQNNEYLTKF